MGLLELISKITKEIENPIKLNTNKIEGTKYGTGYFFNAIKNSKKIASRVIIYPMLGSLYHEWQEQWANEANLPKNTFTKYSLVVGTLFNMGVCLGIMKYLELDLPTLVNFPAYIKLGIMAEGTIELITRATYTGITGKPIGTILYLPWEGFPFLIKLTNKNLECLEYKFFEQKEKLRKSFSFIDINYDIFSKLEKLIGKVKKEHKNLELNLETHFNKKRAEYTKKVKIIRAKRI